MDRVEHGYADNNGVKIHYASLGSGPPIVFIHGFPDFWYSWRRQMAALSGSYRCVAIDQRGYNLSDKPAGQAQYDMMLLVSDVVAVIKSLGVEKAIVCGHDWGGIVAWSTAMYAPQVVDKLIICNLPHPAGLAKELAENPKQQANAQYARDFQQADAHTKLTADALALMVCSKDLDALPAYQEAFGRSDIEAMLHYYKQNYPRPPYTAPARDWPKINVPVLQFHGLADWALLPGGLNSTWEHLGADYTLVTLPGIEHWVQLEAADTVSNTMQDWLSRRP